MVKTFDILAYAPMLEAGEATLYRTGCTKPIRSDAWKKTFMRYRYREKFHVETADNANVVEAIQHKF